MNSRPSRSSSIPIPRSASSSSSARNIEAVLSIPVVSPSRQNVSSSSSARLVIEPRRIGPSVDGSRAITTDTNISVSPIRSTARSASIVSSVPGRAQSSVRTTFEPRVIRGVGPEYSASGEADYATHPGPSPHNRRASTGTVRTLGPPQTVVPQHIVAHAGHSSFERPTYLEYSCFRHLLQTDAYASTGSNRKIDHNKTDIDDAINSTPASSRHLTSIAQPQDQVFNLPTRWSEQHRHQNLTISPDGRDLLYHGPPSNGEKDASVARTNYPAPPLCGIYYFEVEIQGKEQKSFATRNIKTTRMPGWEPNSWGYYGDDGSALTPEKDPANDTIGCGIDFANNTAFYTKNGTLLGNMEWYPVVGLKHVGDVVHTNFGQETFKFDIEYHVQRRAGEVWNTIQSTPLHQTLLQGNRRRIHGLLSIASITNNSSLKPALTDEQSKSMMKQLVASYLVHHGYVKTARAFEAREAERRASTPRPSATDGNHDVEMITSDIIENDTQTRTNVVNLVLSGNIDSAIDSLREHYPSVLEVHDQLFLFKLRCRKFVELILETAEIKKKMSALRTREAEILKDDDTVQNAWVEEGMDIDVDDHLAPPSHSGIHFHETPNTFEIMNPGSVAASSQYESALNAALLYGQTLSNDCQSETRPELQQLFKQTFGIVAWEDPLEAGSPVATLVGHEARVVLAHEINEAILKSQGRPPQPALETLYRHTSVCINELGLLGAGAAAYADMQKEYVI
ncbi:Ran-binding protein 10 [Psilocybe cubensis]|uniref:Ran-binding protein 10 n=1 Tax=Psilocybe cubensis TaxID=181762 RepID=A0ACB8HFE1_PSICU|nr:Ran-binding protein 10 [Psilocybe cubensis]KAH9486651.1 Ran-binding protein 10 [Psilocybe cubensis]